MKLCSNIRFDNSGHVMFKASYVNNNTFLWYSVWMWGLTTVAMSCSRPHMSMTIHFYDTLFECEVWQQWPCHVQGLICQWQYIFMILCLNVRFDNSGHVMLRASYVNDNRWLDSKDHGANMGPIWVLSAPDGPHVGPMNLAIGYIMESKQQTRHTVHCHM